MVDVGFFLLNITYGWSTSRCIVLNIYFFNHVVPTEKFEMIMWDQDLVNYKIKLYEEVN